MQQAQPLQSPTSYTAVLVSVASIITTDKHLTDDQFFGPVYSIS